MRGADAHQIGNELLELQNMAMNQVWENVESIVGGGGVVSLGGVHVGDDSDGLASEDPFAKWGWTPEPAREPPQP